MSDRPMLSYKITGAAADRYVLADMLRAAANSIVDQTRQPGSYLAGCQVDIMSIGGTLILKADRVDPKNINTKDDGRSIKASNDQD